MRFLFFWRGRGSNILIKYSLQSQMSLLFQYLSLLPPCCFLLFVFLLACLLWMVYLLSGAGRTRHRRTNEQPGMESKAAPEHSSQCGWEMIPSVRDELQQVGAGIWPPPRAKAEQRLKVNQGGEEGQLTQSHRSEPVCTILPRQAHSASYPPSTPHTNTPGPPPYCCACVSRRIRRQHGGGGANGVILLAPPPPCC